ncbi:hypothetical protein PMAYCL1PPCAC_06751, partial [Pristionchus mayeri]
YYPLLLLFLSLPLFQSAQPIYEYLRNLCPSDLIPVTGSKNVLTCENKCPHSSKCINGICCSPPPSCSDSSYSYATTLACLPSSKSNCPKGTKCIESSNDGQYICCARTLSPPSPSPHSKIVRGGLSPSDVCPSTHPIAMSDPSKGLMLCNDCDQGICVQFRRSSVMICCQSHEEVCGEGSQVEQRGGVSVDCASDECSPGFECTSSSNNQKVCCSRGVCSNGSPSTRSCAGGCLAGENCESIKGDRWCCPSSEEEEEEGVDIRCPDGSLPFSSCTLGIANECGRDKSCVELSPSSFHCCPLPKNRGGGTTCPDGSKPLSARNEPLSCPEIGAPCPKIGYSCQSSSRGDLLCCR